VQAVLFLLVAAALPGCTNCAVAQDQPVDDGVAESSAARDPAAGTAADSSTERMDGSTVLPWNLPSEEEISPPTKRLSSAREMLELFSIDRSQIEQLQDDRPLVADEEETLLKILYRIPYFGLDKMQAWCRRDVTLDDLADEPEVHRLDVVSWNGRVTGVERVELAAETATRFEFSHYYRVHFKPDIFETPVEQELQVCCRHVPASWEKPGVLNDRANVLGLFLKLGSPADEPPLLVLAADRVAWLPDRVVEDWGITPDHVLLGRLGVDVGLLDQVRKTNGRGMESSDGECFYQMLKAARSQPSMDLFMVARNSLDFDALLNRPESQQGRLFQFTGTARRIQRIVVGEEDIRERFGISHYYQIDMFVPLGEIPVRLGADESAPVFHNTFPVTVCTLRLPEGVPEGDDVSVRLRVAGFYFKLWTYKSEYMSSFDPRQRQLSPLFISDIQPDIEASPARTPLWGWIGGSAFLLSLCFLAAVAWFFRRSDRRFQQVREMRASKSGAVESLDELGLQVSDGPDFSGIE
jgi:hypothetical protein